ncbi:MAG: hypothetical protein ACJAYK_002745 [Crocinitomicaceae bacterium]|jgi:hypothetical protein
MSLSKQQSAQVLFQFDESFEVSYVNYYRGNDLADPQLVVTLERDSQRQSFAFMHPYFNDVDRNLISAQGLSISSVKLSPFGQNQIEVADLKDGMVYFTARVVKNITPTA